MTSPVLETKFYAPRWRSGQVARPRLVERMELGTESKLTLLSAPPGFGKSTLMAEWLADASARGRSVAWLSLDQNDNHAPTFWTYVFRALQGRRPDIGREAIAALETGQPPPIEGLLTVALNEVAADASDLVLVLDDYHVIESRPIHEGIAFLLDHLPPQMHVVMASRADPPLSLPRLRARGQLTEIRAADLRFTPEEAAAFLNSEMGLGLTAANVAALESRTEGWIAALQLEALSMQGRDDVTGFINAFTGDDRYIVDYLVEEVLERQPAEVREFLIKTSILNSLCAPLCDAVTGQGTGKAMLETLERGNLFVVPLDDRREWYRYHHLFADVLQSHLAEEQPEELPRLHGRASDWYAEDGQPDRAIRHALAAPDFGQAASLVELATPAFRDRRQEATVLGWMRALPDDVLRQRPVLSLMYAGALLASGEVEGVEARLRDAERWIEPRADTEPLPIATGGKMVVEDETTFRHLLGRIAIYRAWLAHVLGDPSATAQHASRALEVVPDEDRLGRGLASAFHGLALWSLGEIESAHTAYAKGMERVRTVGFVPDVLASTLALAEMKATLGQLREAMATYGRALAFAAEQGEPVPPGTADLRVGMSEVHLERDELDAATRQLVTSRELGAGASLPEHRFRWHAAMAGVKAAQGDLDGALDMLQDAERLSARGFFPDIRPLAARRARLWVQHGRLSEAALWADECGLSAKDEPSYLREFEHLTLARILIARYRERPEARRAEDTTRLLVRLIEAAEGQGRMAAVIEALALQALLLHASGDTTAALVPLERAVTLAEPEGYVRTFLDEGPAMRDLLRHAPAAGMGGAYARRLLAAFEAPAVAFPGATRENAAGLPEPLTAREIEILRLVAAGMRNQEIADHLVISLPTVKRHIANTYGKLGVDHRTEAVARATELRLLDAAK